MNQLNLFTNITCCHCGNNPGVSPKNSNLWNGFVDKDTGQYVCWGCKSIHYQQKETKTYSEQPVVI